VTAANATMTMSVRSVSARLSYHHAQLLGGGPVGTSRSDAVKLVPQGWQGGAQPGRVDRPQLCRCLPKIHFHVMRGNVGDAICVIEETVRQRVPILTCKRGR
jgi:hypothetical protein